MNANVNLSRADTGRGILGLYTPFRNNVVPLSPIYYIHIRWKELKNNQSTPETPQKFQKQKFQKFFKNPGSATVYHRFFY
jgi:hypothetical protein